MTRTSQLQRARNNQKHSPLTGYHVAAMIVAFFSVIVAANMTMAWFATSSWTGLVVKNGYVASQQYNEKIKAAKLQKAKGWQSSFEFKDERVSFSLVNADKQPVFLNNVVATIGRPVSQDKDIEVKLSHIGQGIYQAKVKLAKGVWNFELQGEAKQTYHSRGRIFVSEYGRGVLQ